MDFLDYVQRVLAIVGALALVLLPLLRAYARQVIHNALADAPALLELKARLATVETWQREHAKDVQLVPRLAEVMDRMEKTLGELSKALAPLGERVARLEGAES